MEHCPSDCHEHTITSIAGVESGSFVAPDHDYPSHLRLQLKVTDSDGLSTTVSEDLQPETGTVSAVSDPAGITLTVDGVAGAPPPTATGIAGGGIDVSAPASVAVGEATYTFDAWSDGGARNHTVTIDPGSNALTASYASNGDVDAPSTCAAAVPGATTGAWRQGEFQTDGDVDWYRFTNSSTRSVEITLGDLPVDASIKLYQGCSTLLSTSDNPGGHTEEIIKSLKAGSYAVKITNKGGASGEPYALRIRRLGTGLSVRSATSHVDDGAGTLALVGEVWNEYASTRGPITVTAKLYDADGHLLGDPQGRDRPLRDEPLPGRVPDRRVAPRRVRPRALHGECPEGEQDGSRRVVPHDRRSRRSTGSGARTGRSRRRRARSSTSRSSSRSTTAAAASSTSSGAPSASPRSRRTSRRPTCAWSKVVDPGFDRAKVRTFGFKP